MHNNSTALIARAREDLHGELKKALFKIDASGIPSIADKDSKASVAFSAGIFKRLNVVSGARKNAQTSGSKFEESIENYLRATFLKLGNLRPGIWNIRRKGTRIDNFQQFLHLSDIQVATKNDAGLAASIGQDYLIRPDIVILRRPETDTEINSSTSIVDENVARMTGIRECNNENEILHASVSCKWTLRSDRAQNARSEGLNLTRNRKGHVPHIAIVTAEPLPSRIASLALGTGDIDFVYHIALNELVESINETDYDDAQELLRTMINGNRLRDVSDLPLDLII